MSYKWMKLRLRLQLFFKQLPLTLALWRARIKYKISRHMLVESFPIPLKILWVTLLGISCGGQVWAVLLHKPLWEEIMTSMYWAMILAYMFGLILAEDEANDLKKKAKAFEEAADKYHQAATDYYQKLAQLQEWIIFPIGPDGEPLDPNNPPWAIHNVEEDTEEGGD